MTESQNAAAIASMVVGAAVSVEIRGATITLSAPSREDADEVLQCLTERAADFLQLEQAKGKPAADVAKDHPEVVTATRRLDFLAVAACLPDVDRVAVGRWLGLLAPDEKARVTNPALDLCGISAPEKGDADSGDFPSSLPGPSGDQ